MTPFLFYGISVLALLMGLGLHATEWLGGYIATRADQRKEQRSEEAVNAYFQTASRDLFNDSEPRRLPAPTAEPIEVTPELAEPLDEFSPGVTGWR